MIKPPLWFTVLVAFALLWNIAGLFAVIADLRLSSADISALSPQQQALYAARPAWSVIASLVAVIGGTLGCLALLIKKKWAVWVLYASLVGVVLQDIWIFVTPGPAKVSGPVPFIIQGLVLAVAIGLLVLARSASAKSWFSQGVGNTSRRWQPCWLHRRRDPGVRPALFHSV